MSYSSLGLLITSWLAYFLLHSWFASIRMKTFVAEHWPRLMPAYRLFYNTQALLLLTVPLWLTISIQSDWIWQWQGTLSWLANAMAIAALAGFFWSLKYYDGSEFIGFKQLYQQIDSVDDQEQFQLSPLHRYVRHPWYFFALVIIWTRDMNIALLISAVMATLYFIIGSRYEETKLIRYHGDQYREYIKQVPGIFPLPWKFLTRARAQELVGRD